MKNTEPYEKCGDDLNANSFTEMPKEKTLQDEIQRLAEDYEDDLEGFMNELSAIKGMSDEEKSDAVHEHFDSRDISDLIYPLFLKCYQNHKEVQRLKDLINETWNISNQILNK